MNLFSLINFSFTQTTNFLNAKLLHILFKLNFNGKRECINTMCLMTSLNLRKV